MKNLSFLFILIALIVSSCSNDAGINDESNTDLIDSTNKSQDLEVINPNPNKMDYEEFYESGALKITGNYNELKQRSGVWTSFYENGTKWSESFYIDGIKEGHSITFFPNGKVRYIGEYKDDVKIGLWRFYSEDGTLNKEENY